MKINKLLGKGVQNPRWSASEIIQGKAYSEKVNIYIYSFHKKKKIYIYIYIYEDK